MTPPRPFLPLLAAILSLPLTLGFAQADKTDEGSTTWKGNTLVVPLGSELLDGGRTLRELERLLDEASKSEAAAIVFEIDLGVPATLAVQQRLLDLVATVNLPSAAFVNATATGPGALAALATDAIYLHPNGIVGGAGLPATETEDGKPDPNLLRDQSILKARARSLAEAHGHRPEIAEAFIDPEVEVRLGETLVSRKGEALTLTATEATRVFEERPLLAKGTTTSVEELIKAEGFPETFVSISPRAYGETANRSRLRRATDSATSSEEPVEKSDSGDSSVEATDESPEKATDTTLFGKRDQDSYKGKVVILKVGQDTLATGKASFDFMDRTLKKAELDGAEAVVFDMDTPGGFAWYTEGLVLNSLQNVSFPTYTFVNARAESAGAIIAVGTDHIYMRPAATIGSALVVSGTGQDLAEAMEDKVTQMIIGSVRNVAELKGHNPDIAEAFVTRNKSVVIDGVVVHEAGNVLNLNTIRATEEIGGRPVLAKGVARDIADLVEQEGLAGKVVEATPYGMEAFAHWVQKLSVLLIVVGLAGAYLELNSPGFGLPGLVSVCAFGLFFFGNYLAGNLAGYELAVLLAVGLILIAVEIFVFPGAILPGVAGVVLVLASLGLAMVDRVDLEWKWSGLPDTTTWIELFQGSLVSLVAGMGGAIVAILLGMRYLPKTRLANRFVLAEAIPAGASLPSAGSGEQAKASLVGSAGVATTDLMPSGKGLFDGRLLDVVSEGEFVARGTPLRIAKQEGSRVVVRRTEE